MRSQLALAAFLLSIPALGQDTCTVLGIQDLSTHFNEATNALETLTESNEQLSQQVNQLQNLISQYQSQLASISTNDNCTPQYIDQNAWYSAAVKLDYTEGWFYPEFIESNSYFWSMNMYPQPCSPWCNDVTPPNPTNLCLRNINAGSCNISSYDDYQLTYNLQDSRFGSLSITYGIDYGADGTDGRLNANYSNLSGMYTEQMFISHANLTGSNFERVQVQSGTFENSDFTGSNFAFSSGPMEFQNCNLTNCNFNFADFENTWGTPGSISTDCVIDGAQFRCLKNPPSSVPNGYVVEEEPYQSQCDVTTSGEYNGPFYRVVAID